VGTVVASFSISLDGCVAGRGDGPDLPLGEGGSRLFDWWNAGSEPLGDDPRFAPLPPSRAAAVAQLSCGAVITGRRTFDIARGWGGHHPSGAPFFLLTHRSVEDGVGPDTGGTVVHGGIDDALARAQAAAGDRNVAVGAADVAGQFLVAGLLDEIHLNVVPIVLGGGVRLFDGAPVTDLECTSVVASVGVTHLRFAVRR
jgi:dihydrofolate reductase